MGRIDILADEHVDRAFVLTLRQEGFDVATVEEDYPQGITDERHLAESLETGRVILTHDDDFTRLGMERDHAGIIRFSNQNHAPGEFVRAIKRIDAYYTPGELRGEIEWLEQWL